MKKATNKAMSIVYTLYSCLSYLIVMGILFIWKREDYIVYAASATKIGIAGFIIIALVCICFANKIMKLIEASNPLFMFSLVGFALCFLGELALAQMRVIFTFSLLGSSISGVFDRVVKVYKDNSYIEERGIRQPNKDPALPQKEAWARAFGINFIAS